MSHCNNIRLREYYLHASILVFSLVAIFVEWRDCIVSVKTGVVVALLSLLIAAIFWSDSDETFTDLRFRLMLLCSVSSFLLIAAILGQFSLFVVFSEDLGWLEFAKEVLNGQRLYPLQPKLDYPSSFPAFPIALFMKLGLSPIVSSRFLSALSFIGSACYAYAVVKYITNSRFASLLGVFFIFTVGPIYFFAITGWHEVAHVSLLMLGTWFYFLRLSEDKGGRRSALAFGLFAGLSVWTLYTPALWAVILSFFLMLSRSRNKSIALLSVFSLSSPLIGQVLNPENAIFSRHFTVFGNQVEGIGFVSSVSSTLARLFGKDLLPLSHDAFYFFDLAAPSLTYSFLILFIFGVGSVVVVGKNRLVKVLIYPFVLLFVGIVLSNPTTWRESCLVVPMIVFAALGCHFLFAFLPKWLAVSVVAFLLVLQVFNFTERLTTYERVALLFCPIGQAAQEITNLLETRLDTNRVILPEGYLFAMVKALSVDNRYYQKVSGVEDACRILHDGGGVAFFYFRPDESEEVSKLRACSEGFRNKLTTIQLLPSGQIWRLENTG